MISVFCAIRGICFFRFRRRIRIKSEVSFYVNKKFATFESNFAYFRSGRIVTAIAPRLRSVIAGFSSCYENRFCCWTYYLTDQNEKN